jgi:glycosyltransferase involved in cell wall biosynthesis
VSGGAGLRILVLTHNYPRFYGDFSGTFIEALSEAMQAQGCQVTVLTPFDVRFARRPDDHAVDLRTYRYIWPPRLHMLGYMRSTQGDRSLRRSSVLLAPFMLFSGALATMFTAMRQHPDVIHAHWVLPNGFLGALTARLLRIPLVVSLPGSDVFVSGMNPLFLRMARFAFSQAAAITTNSTDLLEAATALGADPGRIRLIIYGVDPAVIAPDASGRAVLRAKLGIDPAAPVILAVGRLVAKKGFDVLVKALPSIQLPAVVVIVGDGPERATLEGLAERGGVRERICFAGSVPRNELTGYYNMADIFAMPSVRLPVDGLNVAVVEAMACALPIVASDVGGNPLVVNDGGNGLLVEEGDAPALAAAINRLLADPSLRAEMGLRSRERVLAEFSWQNLAAAYRSLFDEVQPTQRAG